MKYIISGRLKSIYLERKMSQVSKWNNKLGHFTMYRSSFYVINVIGTNACHKNKQKALVLLYLKYYCSNDCFNLLSYLHHLCTNAFQ